jgi:NTE family protein
VSGTNGAGGSGRGGPRARERPRVAVVLPGGGARGAYEVGALSVLLAALEERGERVDLWCGTSVGAVNAALFASLAHLDAADSAAAASDGWASLGKSDVTADVIGPGLPWMALRIAGDWLGIPGAGASGLLDPAPLRRSLDRWIDWLSVARNVRGGLVEALCVVATSLEHGAPVAFVHAAPGVSLPDADDVRYVRTCLSSEHVRASAAIPLLFPPVEIDRPAADAGFYTDGATRLNSPVKPAVALGADRVIIVGFDPVASQDAPPRSRGGRPHLADIAGNVLDGLLVDPVAADVHRLATINAFFVEGVSGPQDAARTYRRVRGRPPYRRIAYALVAPERRGELGRIAQRVFGERYGGLRGLRSPDFALMSRLLGSRAASRGELLSFLFFDSAFIAELMAAGRRDAERWLARHPHFWCTDAEHDLGVALSSRAAQEEARVREWRDLSRRR